MIKKVSVKTKKLLRFFAVDDIKIFIYCYIISLLAVVVFVLLSFAMDRLLRATGALQSETLSWEDITPIEIIPTEDGKIFSYSVDPQILLPPKEQLISSIELKVDFEGETGELSAYYTDNPDADFSVLNRVYGYHDDEGAVFEFGLKKVSSLRIDPSSYVTTLGYFNGIEINPIRSFSDFVRINGATFYFMAVVPAMIAAIICTFKHIWVKNELSTS